MFILHRTMTRFVSLLGLALCLMATTSPVHAVDKTLEIGDRAPDFSLTDQNGKQHRLVDYRGRWVILYFYPKDDTPGCIKEACRFRDDNLEFGKRGADVLGVSIDNRDSHAAFSEKYGLPFPLLADTGGKVAGLYGSYFSFGPLHFARRHSFIIDPDGRIASIYRKVDPAIHSSNLLHDLTELQKQRH